MKREKTIFTGVDIIDKDLGGLKSGEVTLIGGRPGMGKTTLALQIALNVAKTGRRVLFFSAESSRVELKLRLISIISGIPPINLLNWDLTDDEWELFKRTTGTLRELPIQFFHADTLYGIKYLCKEYIGDSTDILIYDYLQHIRMDYSDNNVGKSYNTPVELLLKFKKIAKKYEIPVIVLTQLSKKLEKREDRHPKVKDIRVKDLSGHAYDNAVLIYRADYYDIDDTDGTAELTVVRKAAQVKKTCKTTWNRRLVIFDQP